MKEVNMIAVRESHKYNQWGEGDHLKAHQVAVFVMCGGGHLGHMAARQPADFYIDDRCGDLPYARDEIMQAVTCLGVLATEAGYDPHSLPQMPTFHNCGIF